MFGQKNPSDPGMAFKIEFYSRLFLSFPIKSIFDLAGQVCNMMTVSELNRLYHKDTGIVFSSMYPGCIAETALFREKRSWFRKVRDSSVSKHRAFCFKDFSSIKIFSNFFAFVLTFLFCLVTTYILLDAFDTLNVVFSFSLSS
jgi:hypothetical protein